MPNISTMTGEQLRDARHALGMSTSEFADFVSVSDARSVRRWEDNTRDIPGPVEVLVRAVMNSKQVRKYFGLTLASDIVERVQ